MRILLLLLLRAVVVILLLLLLLSSVHIITTTSAAPAPRQKQQPSTTTVDSYLSQGDEYLSQGKYEQAIELYTKGIQKLPSPSQHDEGDEEDDDNDDDDIVSLVTEISLHTNLATALSSIGQDEQAAVSYQNALVSYKRNIDDIIDKKMKNDAKSIVAQSAFFLGMVYQDLHQPQDAVDAYKQALTLDPLLWSAAANLGSVLHDELSSHTAALAAYNDAYAILTNTETEPTDPPTDPKPILSQLQYRIGLCIVHDANRKCAIQDDPNTQVDCNEMATHAFGLAVKFDPNNESAKHMLATMTADATLKRASNTYVKSLFDDYAKNFEHSLVQELGYTGYERLRRGFDRAFKGKPPTFDLVIDAGCGTGLVGEQFRNVSKTLVGVDLSEAILEQAVQARPGLYDETLAMDLIEVFENRYKAQISFIVAGDSYIYFGDLDPLFRAMHIGLEDDGYVAFTLENVDEENEKVLSKTKPDWRWQLTASGRFAHRKEYVLQVGESHGLRLIHYEKLENFRYERGVGVQGHVFVMKKEATKEEL